MGPKTKSYNIATFEDGVNKTIERITIDINTIIDKLIDALDLVAAEKEKNMVKNRDNNKKNMKMEDYLLFGLSPQDYVWTSLTHIHPELIKQALLMLPFSSVKRILHYLPGWLSSFDYIGKVTVISSIIIKFSNCNLKLYQMFNQISSSFKNLLPLRDKICMKLWDLILL